MDVEVIKNTGRSSGERDGESGAKVLVTTLEWECYRSQQQEGKVAYSVCSIKGTESF